MIKSTAYINLHSDVKREAFEELAMRLEILEHEREEKAAMAR